MLSLLSRSPYSAAVILILAFAPVFTFAACADKGKESAAKAKDHVKALVALTAEDVAEVERGLPEGAKKVAVLYDKGADPKQDLPAVRARLIKVRREVLDLTKAKSTFFALADDHGVGIRNDLEQDAMAGQSVLAGFPDLKKALDGAADYVATVGAFAGTNTPTSTDRDWVAACPVKKDDGKVAGLFFTGWSYRRFALHLQSVLVHDLGEALRDAGDTGKMPILYVAVFDRTGVYSAPKTPPVDEKALADLGLVDRTASGPVDGTLTITDRPFGYAAARAPRLGPEVGVAVLRSEI
jgi:hypothetical protein